MNTQTGAIRIARVLGVDIYLHWSWLIIFYLVITSSPKFSSPVWIAFIGIAYALERVAYEFGHIIACRLTGGTATELQISFLGRGANCVYPARPWPTLFTALGGIMASFVLAGMSIGFYFFVHDPSLAGNLVFNKDLLKFAEWTAIMMVFLAIYSGLPIYPLDGGRVLWAFLWMLFGRVAGLMIVSILGLLCAAAAIAAALYFQQMYFTFITFFVVIQCLSGISQARKIAKFEKLPRHEGLACPKCTKAPIRGAWWPCACGNRNDPFAVAGVCPRCASTVAVVACPECGDRTPLQAWRHVSKAFPVNVYQLPIEPMTPQK